MGLQPQVIHLDQKDFINLAKAQQGGPGGAQFAAALAAAKVAASSGAAVFPLSNSHYVETSKNSNHRQRRDLAFVMGGLSRFVTMSPPQPIIDAEVDLALHGLTGLPEKPRTAAIFGIGMAHAVGLSDPSAEVWSSNDLDVGGNHPLVVEHLLLESPDGPTPFDDERRAKASDFAVAAESLAASLMREPPPQTTRSIMFDLLGLWDFRGTFIAAQADAGLPPDYILQLPRDELEDFIRGIPTLHVLAELRRLGHENPQKRWEPQDLHDLRSLAVALVYADAVFCDKRWHHEIVRSGVAEPHGTTVHRRTEELEDVLASST